MTQRGLSVADFARNYERFTDAGPSAVEDVVSQKITYVMRLNTLVNICDALRVSPNLVLGYEKNEELSLDDQLFFSLLKISQWSDDEILNVNAQLWKLIEQVKPESADHRIITPPRPTQYRVNIRNSNKSSWRDRRK